MRKISKFSESVLMGAFYFGQKKEDRQALSQKVNTNLTLKLNHIRTDVLHDNWQIATTD